jgi:uncharacterized membrane protein
MEAVIGKNWASWVGAIVVVLGVFFFLKYAWDQGWLVLSPAARVWTAIFAGVCAASVGLWLSKWRESMRVLSGTLMGLGVAVGMSACFAGHVMFEPAVFSRFGATVGVILCAAAGIGLSVYANVMSLAIVAMVGAYLAPAILRGPEDQSLALVGYLGALAVAGWALAYLRPRWKAVRVFVWVCTVVWVGVWMLGPGLRQEHRALAMGAIGFFYLGFLGESFLSLHRAFRIRYEPQGDAYPEPAHATRLDGELGVLSMLSTAAAFGGLYAVLDRAGAGRVGLLAMHPMAAVAIGMACLHAVVAFATPGKLFVRSSIVQSAALVTLAVPLAFGEFAITLGWLALAAGLAVVSWKMKKSRAVKVWAVVLLGLALGRVFTFDLMDRTMRVSWFEVFGQRVSPWLLLAWFCAVLAHAVGWIVGDTETRCASGAAKRLRGEQSLGAMVAGVGTLCFLVASGMWWRGDALTVLWCAWLAGLIALSERGAFLGYATQALIVAAVVGLKWLGVDGVGKVLADWSGAGVSAAPVFNTFALAGIVVVGLIVWLGRRVSEVRETALVCALALAFGWLNFEVLRFVDWTGGSFADVGKAKHVALSLLWGVMGLGAVIVGFARRLSWLRYAALGLLGVTLVKIMIVDMARVQAVYRILSFVAVGVVLLCVSFVYHRRMGEQMGET